MKRTITFAARLIPYAFVLLFTYAAVSKLMDFENFRVQLAQSPLLGTYPDVMAYTIITVLLLTVLLLCFRESKTAGLYTTLIFASLSMLYIGMMLINKDNLPCTCIAFFEKLSWKSNFWFSTGLSVAACTSLCVKKKGLTTYKN